MICHRGCVSSGDMETMVLALAVWSGGLKPRAVAGRPSDRDRVSGRRKQQTQETDL